MHLGRAWDNHDMGDSDRLAHSCMSRANWASGGLGWIAAAKR